MAMTADDVRRTALQLVRLIEAKEYFAVAGSRRFQAVRRRLTRSSARAAMLVIAAAAPLHIVVLSLIHPSSVVPIAAVDGSLAITAIAAWWALGRRLHHHTEAITFVVTLLVGADAIALALLVPHVVTLAVAYLMVLPALVALFIPWRTYTEVRWLAVYGCATMAFVVLAPAPPGEPLSSVARSDLVVALSAMLAISFVGRILLTRQQIETFSQLQAIARLQRSGNSQRVELERVYRSLEVTARTDDLTRVGNRLKLEEDLAAVRARVGRTGRPFGLLEVDLDRFKAVNDQLGHLAGDAVLRRVAAALRDTIRADDTVYRYGGEEFLVILGTIAGGVASAAERVRNAVEALELAHPANEPYGVVTVSVGAVALGPADLDLSADEWFARVDAALYEAKSAGRNRVAVATAADTVGEPDRPAASPARPHPRSALERAS